MTHMGHASTVATLAARLDRGEFPGLNALPATCRLSTRRGSVLALPGNDVPILSHFVTGTPAAGRTHK